MFHVESKAAVELRKKDATRALVYAPDRGDSQSIYHFGIQYSSNQPPIFTKPSWRRDMTPEELTKVEEQAYFQWMQTVAEAQQEYQQQQEERDANEVGVPKINMYERNIEVWRQLWRVIERCSVLVHLADARCPLLHLSDNLITHITRDRPSKRIVVVLTKADLVDKSRVQAWVEYLESRYDGKISVLAYSMEDPETSNAVLMRTIGAASATIAVDEKEVSVREDEQDALIVGFVGEPNVGKSSLLNSLFGRKLVSVSATPGHTKHLQTHFFERAELLERGDEFSKVVMCDCPGVVFPRFNVPLSLQILFGSFPIAQTREPFSAVRFIAENCLPYLHEIYKLRPVEDDDGGALYSGDVVCVEATVFNAVLLCCCVRLVAVHAVRVVRDAARVPRERRQVRRAPVGEPHPARYAQWEESRAVVPATSLAASYLRGRARGECTVVAGYENEEEQLEFWGSEPASVPRGEIGEDHADEGPLSGVVRPERYDEKVDRAFQREVFKKSQEAGGHQGVIV